MNALKIAITQIELTDVGKAVPLFDAYRQFYGKPSNHEAAEKFLCDRLRANESIVALASVSKGYVGLAQCFHTFSSVNVCRTLLLNDLFVAPEARGKGVGTALLTYAGKLAQESGAARLVLETTRWNAAARALYARNGWVEDDDAVLCQRVLGDGPEIV